MKMFEDFQRLIAAVTYKKGWLFHVRQDHLGVYLQIEVTEEAGVSLSPFEGKKTPWKGAKISMSQHMCDSEVIGTVFDAIKRAEEHEMREWFRFMNKPIFNPHISVYALAGIAGKLANLDMRENAMTMKE